jgi:sodium transport system permease protein
VPALAQNLLMTRVLKGEAFGLADFAIPLCVAMMLGAAALGSVARSLRTAAWR